MKAILVIKDLNQLKTLSDPFRTKLMMLLIEKPYTGQQLAEKLNLSRARVHYHLHELEKNRLIEQVRTEEINGIVQKFYQSVAQSFLPDAALLPQKKAVSASYRQIVLSMIDRTRARALQAPDEAFSKTFTDTSDRQQLEGLATYWEMNFNEELFAAFYQESRALFEKYSHLTEQLKDDPTARPYFLSGFAFQVGKKEFGQHLD
ncbi:MAG: winged helix-turn-helix domain-containing protein [Sporolactobacillus sp.]